MKRLAIPNLLRLPLLLGIPVLLLLLALWLLQQTNIDSLQQQTNVLKKQIDTLPATVAPKDKLNLEKDRLTLEQSRVSAQNAIYSTLIQALGGAFFVVTAYFTYRDVRATEATVKAAEDKQITERFSKSIEQLGSDNLAVRLGGIYALERISIDSQKDYWTIMEVLTSFIQERSPLQQDKQQNTNAKDTGKFATDVQAALTVIGRRDSRKDPEGNRIVLNFANLRKAHLLGADLREAHLLGADLSGADLLGADLSGAHLLGADLSGVHLLGAILRETDLSGADLSGADLREVKHLTQEQVKEAITDENTQLPDYLKVINSSQPDVPDQKQP